MFTRLQFRNFIIFEPMFRLVSKLRNILGVVGICLLGTGFSTALAQEKPFEPHMHIQSEPGTKSGVALTFDACSGGVDHRILDVLIAERIPATLFITSRWLRDNQQAFATMLDHPDLFQIEDHGAEHIPPVLGSEPVYGIAPAGTAERIAAEVMGGSASLMAAGAPQPHWYRGATALYSPAAIPLIQSLGYRVAGFSLNADYGASASAEVAMKNIAGAKDGDVVIAHINQPTRASGAGIAKGLIALKKSGVRFVRLDEVHVVDE